MDERIADIVSTNDPTGKHTSFLILKRLGKTDKQSHDYIENQDPPEFFPNDIISFVDE